MPTKVVVDHAIGGIFLGVGVIIIFRVPIEKRMESLIMSIKKILPKDLDLTHHYSCFSML